MDLADLVRAGAERQRVVSGWLRSPALHFVLVGIVLFAGRAAYETAAGPKGRSAEAPRTVTVTSADRTRLALEFERRFGATPSDEQLRARVADFVDQEILYREAKRLALDFQDASVRRRLVEKMRAVSDRPGRGEDELVDEARQLGFDDDVVVRRLLAEKMRLVLRGATEGSMLTDDQLRKTLDANRSEFVQPPRRTVSHVFLATEVHGSALEKHAARTLEILRSPGDDAAPAALSDAFPLGLELRSITRLGLQARFGKPFADEVFALPPDVWSGPIRSPYGLHLVRVRDVRPEALPPVEEIRPRLLQLAMAESGEWSLAEGMSRLRALYEVRVEDAAAPR